MKLLRPLVALAVIVLACWVSATYVAHHESESPFNQLYMHLMAAPLVLDAHAEPGTHAEHASESGSEGAGAYGEAEEAHPAEVPAVGHGAQHFLLSLTVPGLPAAVDVDPATDGVQIAATNLQVFQVAAVLLVLILFSGVAGHVRRGGGDWFSRRLSGFAMWVRDEMVYPVMGEHHGRRFLPWFLTVFFFVLFMNLLGLVPGAATATASIFVTGALATITLLSMVVCGMVVQGPVAFWKHLVPHVPLALWPLMFVVEVIGLLVKPFALMVRLFANMTGGHMVVLSFMGLIFFFAAKGAGLGWAVSPIAVAFAVFIMIIEAFVALLQAYIFTQLTILFVSASMHPEH